MAPGVDIITVTSSTVEPGSAPFPRLAHRQGFKSKWVENEPYHSNRKWVSGSSFAAPHVAALLAIQRFLHPDWNTKAVIDSVITANKSLPDCYGEVNFQLEFNTNQIQVEVMNAVAADNISSEVCDCTFPTDAQYSPSSPKFPLSGVTTTGSLSGSNSDLNLSSKVEFH